jgi:hypothetical protein
MIGPDIPIITVHQTPTYQEVLQFAYQIYQENKEYRAANQEQEETLRMCQSTIQQQKDEIGNLHLQVNCHIAAFSELEDQCIKLEAENKELRTRAIGNALDQATEWVIDAANRDAENFVLKQQVAERDETIAQLRNRHIPGNTQEIAERDETISNQEQIIQRNNKEHQAETNRLEARIQADWQWRERERRLFANPDLDPSDKLLLWADLDFIETSKMSPTEPTVLWIEGISQSIGLSTTTIHTHHQTLQKKCHCLTIHSEKKLEDKAKGDIRTYTTLTLDKIVSTNPEDIHKDGGKKWGGARKKNCPKCGSENVDQFSILYCRDCQNAAWYGTAGLRKDADMMVATEAIVREYQEKQQASNQHNHEETCTKQVAFSTIKPETRTKQVAFASQEDKEPIILDNHRKNQSDQAETHAVETLDLVAVAVENQENELEAVGYSLPTAASSSCMRNPATCACCEGIDMDYPPIHRCYNCGASNYEWNHMRRRWLCSWCGATPAF